MAKRHFAKVEQLSPQFPGMTNEFRSLLERKEIAFAEEFLCMSLSVFSHPLSFFHMNRFVFVGSFIKEKVKEEIAKSVRKFFFDRSTILSGNADLINFSSLDWEAFLLPEAEANYLTCSDDELHEHVNDEIRSSVKGILGGEGRFAVGNKKPLSLFALFHERVTLTQAAATADVAIVAPFFAVVGILGHVFSEAQVRYRLLSFMIRKKFNGNITHFDY